MENKMENKMDDLQITELAVKIAIEFKLQDEPNNITKIEGIIADNISIPMDAEVKPEIAEEELLNFKQKLYKAQVNMIKEFKPKEHQVILDFIATINKEDLQ